MLVKKKKRKDMVLSESTLVAFKSAEKIVSAFYYNIDRNILINFCTLKFIDENNSHQLVEAELQLIGNAGCVSILKTTFLLEKYEGKWVRSKKLWPCKTTVNNIDKEFWFYFSSGGDGYYAAQKPSRTELVKMLSALNLKNPY